MGSAPCHSSSHCYGSICTHTDTFLPTDFILVHASIIGITQFFTCCVAFNKPSSVLIWEQQQTNTTDTASQIICWFQGKAITWFMSCVLCQLVDLECNGEQYYWTDSSHDLLSPAHNNHSAISILHGSLKVSVIVYASPACGNSPCKRKYIFCVTSCSFWH
jgi:hypothetical protein